MDITSDIAAGVTASLAWPVSSCVGPGLRGALATETRVARLDATRDAMWLGGRDIGFLIAGVSFARVAAWVAALADTDAGTGAVAHAHASATFAARVDAAFRVTPVDDGGTAGDAASPLAALRVAVSRHGLKQDASSSTPSVAEYLGMCWKLALGAMPNGAPDTIADGFGAALLGALGTPGASDPAARAAAEALLVALSDDELSPPTFTALVVGSTLPDAWSPIVAALCACSGLSCAGALTHLAPWLAGRPTGAEPALPTLPDRDGPLPIGFGHAVFRARDPRIAPLETHLQSIDSDGRVRRAEAPLVDTACRAHPGTFPNVLLRAAAMSAALGIPTRWLPVVFALSRLLGISARLVEYRASNRLFRPLDRYVGTPARALGGSP